MSTRIKKIERRKTLIDIYQEGQNRITLSFENEGDAKYAFTILNNTIYELRPNCEIQIPDIPEPTYKVYTAYLYFEYNYSPLGTIFENTIGDIDWQWTTDIYGDASNIQGWKGVLNGAFPANKLWTMIYQMDIDGNGGSGALNTQLTRNNNNELFFIVSNSLSIYYNMEIRVY